MSLFKKSTPKQTAKPVTQSISYPIEISFWDDHYEGISKLLEECEIDLNTLHASGYCNGKLVPEPDNDYDPNAVMVYAAPKGRGKTYHHIGYIPSEDALLIRSDIKKVVAGTHYWSIRISFDARDGLSFTIGLHESKFNR